MKAKIKVHKVVDEKRSFRDQRTGVTNERRVLCFGAMADDGEMLSLTYYPQQNEEVKIPTTGALCEVDLLRYEKESAIMATCTIRSFEVVK